VKRDDLVVDQYNSTMFGLVLTAGPKSIDVIEECGGTSRHRRDACPWVLVTDPKAAFGGDPKYEASVRAELAKEAMAARAERRRGARVRRGLISPR
jgi:hypothetical protein